MHGDIGSNCVVAPCEIIETSLKCSCAPNASSKTLTGNSRPDLRLAQKIK